MIKMCKVLGLYPPNYYKWEHQEKKREERRFSKLGYVKQIERIFNENRRNIGYRGVRQRLLQEGSEYRDRIGKEITWKCDPEKWYRGRIDIP